MALCKLLVTEVFRLRSETDLRANLPFATAFQGSKSRLAKPLGAGYQLAMKKLILAVCCGALLCGYGFAQETSTNSPAAATNSVLRISAAEAKAHVGSEVILTGKVAEVNGTERLMRLNLDKAYPNQTITAVIFANKTNLFPEVEKLQHKTVEISGKIEDYRGRPEIILTSTNQLKVVEQADEKQSEVEKK